MPLQPFVDLGETHHYTLEHMAISGLGGFQSRELGQFLQVALLVAQLLCQRLQFVTLERLVLGNLELP